jgi:hypothetical protein
MYVTYWNTYYTHLTHFMIYEFLSVMIIKATVIWNVISTLNEATVCSEMLAQIYQTTWYHYEDRDDRLLPNI